MSSRMTFVNLISSKTEILINAPHNSMFFEVHNETTQLCPERCFEVANLPVAELSLCLQGGLEQIDYKIIFS
jgi:hypothetical protein